MRLANLTNALWGRSHAAEVPPDRIEAEGRVPSGFRLLPNFVPKPWQDEITAWVGAHVAWSGGTAYDCRMENFVQPRNAIPEWGEVLGTRMVEAGIFEATPNYLLLIEYKAGRGIPPHVDREELGEVVAGLTLGSSRVFHLGREERAPTVRVLLRPGDLYILSGEARHRWHHGVEATPVDSFRGHNYPRSDGLSASWRSFPHGPTWISDYANGVRQ